MLSAPELMAFLDAQTDRQSRLFGGTAPPRLLALLGTSRNPQTALEVAVRRVTRLSFDYDANAVLVELRGTLPRPLQRDECATAIITDYIKYRGYQIKTEDQGTTAGAPPILPLPGSDTRLTGKRVYSVHLGPNVLRIFERIPFDDIHRDVARVDLTVIGVGIQANLSPRFVFRQVLRDGRIWLFHGEGHTNKSYLNLQVNSQASRIVLDQSSGAGWCLTGRQEEYAAADEPEATARIDAGFKAGGWDRPYRYFRFCADAWAEVRP